jgi:hypothetical protein
VRIVLKILSIALWVAIIGTLLLIWRFWRFGDFGALLATGAFGLITVFGWALTLAVGPFAAFQLWRLRESGRMAASLLAGFNLLYYVVPPLFSRQSTSASPKLWLAIGGNAFLLLLLLSPSARRACEPQSRPVSE